MVNDDFTMGLKDFYHGFLHDFYKNETKYDKDSQKDDGSDCSDLFLRNLQP